VLLASGAENPLIREVYMSLLVRPIEQRFNPVFRTNDLTSQEMDRICDAIEVAPTCPPTNPDVGGYLPFQSIEYVTHDLSLRE
jgi:hypothetical protein